MEVRKVSDRTLLMHLGGKLSVEPKVELRNRDELDIPVFRDDQHGTAIVVLAALINALRVVGKDLDSVKSVVSGAGAAGHASIRLLHAQGATTVATMADEAIVLVAAAEAIADCVSADELNPSYIVPSVFDPRVALAVAEAVVATATAPAAASV